MSCRLPTWSLTVSWDRSVRRCAGVLIALLLLPAFFPAWWNSAAGRNDASSSERFQISPPDDALMRSPWLTDRLPLPQAADHGLTDSALLASIEQAFPSLGEKLGQRATFVEATRGSDAGWRPSHDLVPPAGLQQAEQQAWLAMAARQGHDARALEMFFPQRFTRPQEVATNGLRIEVQPLNARPVVGQPVDGRMVYANAYRDTDVIYTAGAGHSEEFLHLRTPSAPTVFIHRLTAGPHAPALTSVAVQADGSIQIDDAQGHRVRIERPYVVDALGTRSESVVAWRVERELRTDDWSIRLELKPDGLRYPLLVDPSWTTVRYMNEARSYHTTTLLTSGKILVVGGSDSNGSFASAELFDPSTGTWTATGALATARGRGA